VVLDGRTSQFVFHQEADGQIHVSLFLPGTDPDPALLRRLDLVQRFLQRGQLREVLECVGPLLEARPVDPVAGCIGGYLLSRERRLEPLGQLAAHLVERYPTLPDAYICRARHAELTGQYQEAQTGYRDALDRGFPIFARNLRRLAEEVARARLDHPRAALLQQVSDRTIPGLLWSAWTPEPGWPDASSPPPVARPSETVRPSGTPSALPTGFVPFAAPALVPVGRALSPSTQGAKPMHNLKPHPQSAARYPAAQPAAAPPTVPAVPSTAPKPGYCLNQPNGGPLIPSNPATLAKQTKAMADTSKLWQKGATLNVGFMNGDDPWNQMVRQAVRSLAPVWSQYANIKFAFDQQSVHMAINLLLQPQLGINNYGVYNCFLGTDCWAVFQQNPEQPSMNLVFDPGWQSNPGRDREFHRVIQHEFGHAIGLIHEHQRPDKPITWNFDKLRQAFGSFWPDQMIQQQIVDFYQGGVLLGTGFDIHSIMMYQFPSGSAFYPDGTPFESPTNFDLSPMDKVLANMLYPASGVTDPDEVALVLGAQPVNGSIQTAGQVARYRFHVTTPGIYSANTQGDPLLVSVLSKRQDPAGQMLAVEGANTPCPFRAVDTDKDYYIEVRHAKPMTGTGSFSIAVSQQQ
jgi:hypothetical protein